VRIEDAKIRTPSLIEEKPKNKLRTSIYTEDYRGEYYNISVDKLIPFKNQARKFFDQQSIESLAATIKEHGIRQPLTIVPSEVQDGYYEIVSGERRFKAALLVGLTTVPCIILHDKKKAEEIAIIENIQREDLHPIELMKAYSSLLEQGICSSMQEIGTKLGIAKSAVVETINLKSLSEYTQTLLLQNKIINRELFRILCKEDASKQHELVECYIKEHKIKKSNQSLYKKRRIISLILSGEILSINENKLTLLSLEQKNNVKTILQNLINSL
jgi:ParB family chromosome partitioning protein